MTPFPQYSLSLGSCKFRHFLLSGQTQPNSTLQKSSQPSATLVFPSSHIYPFKGSSIPFPQLPTGLIKQIEPVPRMPMHLYPACTWHPKHPAWFPLSHCSPYSKILLPQTGAGFSWHFDGSPSSPVQKYPFSIRQCLLHPSPSTKLPSSQD